MFWNKTEPILFNLLKVLEGVDANKIFPHSQHHVVFFANNDLKFKFFLFQLCILFLQIINHLLQNLFYVKYFLPTFLFWNVAEVCASLGKQHNRLFLFSCLLSLLLTRLIIWLVYCCIIQCLRPILADKSLPSFCSRKIWRNLTSHNPVW